MMSDVLERAVLDILKDTLDELAMKHWHEDEQIQDILDLFKERLENAEIW